MARSHLALKRRNELEGRCLVFGDVVCAGAGADHDDALVCDVRRGGCTGVLRRVQELATELVLGGEVWDHGLVGEHAGREDDVMASES